MKASTPAPETREVRIPCGQAWLYGDLALPTGFTGLVLFVHGSGSGRHSARNRQVAQKLQQSGIATLQHRFDIALLTERIQQATAWVMTQPTLQQAAIELPYAEPHVRWCETATGAIP